MTLVLRESVSGNCTHGHHYTSQVSVLLQAWKKKIFWEFGCKNRLKCYYKCFFFKCYYKCSFFKQSTYNRLQFFTEHVTCIRWSQKKIQKHEKSFEICVQRQNVMSEGDSTSHNTSFSRHQPIWYKVLCTVRYVNKM